ncbi:MAG: methyltransferase domain-containing protein [Deltaproteobacteria bacterium]|nr:methyltransferase domain-containing protein [Deltaproteobacteria bacterium]
MQNVDQHRPGGIVRPARRPTGWIAPGPRPVGACGHVDLAPRAGEDLCFLSGDWRIFQLVDGHRFSLDDLATAWFAAESATAQKIDLRRVADLGCGIGSVLMMVAWRFPTARVVGVEAQPPSVDLARRSLAWNGADDRCDVRRGDLRDPTVIPEAGAFDLVTGTPPYFPPENGTVSLLPQRGPCRFEAQGGIEDYCAAASRIVAPSGLFVCCFDSRHPTRVHAAATLAGLHVVRTLDVIPRFPPPITARAFDTRNHNL